MFPLRYAHRHFGDGDGDGDWDGTIDRSAKFPGDPPRNYQDIIYLAVCVGATAQVSDVGITAYRYRRLVTQAAILAFIFNTMVVALGINIGTGIIGHWGSIGVV